MTDSFRLEIPLWPFSFQELLDLLLWEVIVYRVRVLYAIASLCRWEGWSALSCTRLF
jgi:hypothetical protein